ncbi:DNA polymerase kappa [Diospyros lotus]|uniref:DNA polymerase kappa n=1 Tax=Diospyros lotus TaxID=55363 RepID=UPI002251AEAF|nr:DNA polymerase kappa [Diospyros lotus]
MAKGESSGDTSRPWQSYHTAYTNAKAGMEGVDKEKVQRIVYEMSKGSKYFENEERKMAFIKQKIENMRAHCAKLTASDISHYQKVADKRILELEVTRDLKRIWLHVDMDAFYAAVETLSNPSLKGKPVAVGSMSMISTANYEARKFGVRAAMPGFIARKLCPQLIFVPTDFEKYTHYSDLTRKVFQRYDPNFVAASLDEAYLNITNVCTERGIAAEEVAEEIRRSVYEETGLTCSAGVAPNRLLAKVCSDINKPNGQFVLPNNRMAVMTFISSLPYGSILLQIGGIGKVTEHLLKDVFGITTCEEMLEKRGFLCALFSRSSADFFLSVGLGLGGTETPEARLRKSISNERTFSATDNEALLHQKLADLADMLSADMKREGVWGRTLTLKLKTASFEVRTRAVTLQRFICSSEDILKHAAKLLKAELPISLRLIGLRMSQLNEDSDGAPSDPTQKTLSNFIMSRDSTGRNMDDPVSCGSDHSDGHFLIKPELTDNYEKSHTDFRDALNCNEVSDPTNGTCNFHNKNDTTEETSGSPENKSGAKADTFEIMRGQQVSYEAESAKVINGDTFSLSGQLEGGGLDGVNKTAKLFDDGAVSSSNQKEQDLWVDDYKCSLCGVELPPSFVEERQEHSDFHFAERLQKEESDCNPRNLTLSQRFTQKDRVTSQSKQKKKQKLSPRGGNHLPIDMFFVKKRSENL